MSNSWQSPILATTSDKAVLGSCDGCQTAIRFDSLAREHDRLRQGIGLVDNNHYGKFSVQGASALPVVNRLVVGDVSRLPISRMMSSFTLRPDGTLLCDTYIYNQGDRYLVLTEGTPPSDVLAVLQQEATAAGATVTDLTQQTGLLELDGPFAWELLKGLIGIKILGVKYMGALEGQAIDGAPVTLFRAGKTGEFGYLIVHEAKNSPALWNKLLAAGKDFDLLPCGQEALALCKLENRFVNMNHEGKQARNILELNCRVMIGKDKDSYIGDEPTKAAMQTGPQRRAVGLTFAATADALPALGSEIQYKGNRIGVLANAGYAPSLSKGIGLAFLDVAYGYSGLDYTLKADGKELPVQTVSAPFVLNRSLTIRPQEDSYKR